VTAHLKKSSYKLKFLPELVNTCEVQQGKPLGLFVAMVLLLRGLHRYQQLATARLSVEAQICALGCGHIPLAWLFPACRLLLT